MRKGFLWFPDSLVGKFVFVPGLLGAGAGMFAIASERIEDPIIMGFWMLAFVLTPATLGLLVFGATMPFVACWAGMRQAGYGYLRCILGMLSFVAVLSAVAAVMFGINMVGLSWIWGIGVLFLPLSIYDVIKLRRLRVVHTEPALPEVRR